MTIASGRHLRHQKVDVMDLMRSHAVIR